MICSCGKSKVVISFFSTVVHAEIPKTSKKHTNEIMKRETHDFLIFILGT
jgi:hypothetical protein